MGETMGELVYIPIPQDLLGAINFLKEENEQLQDFIRRLVEEQVIKKEVESIQKDKMLELWNNEEDEIWEKMY